MKAFHRFFKTTSLLCVLLIGHKHHVFDHNEWHEIGKSVEGRPIQMANFGTGVRTILFIGVIHGNEKKGKKLLHLLYECLRLDPEKYKDSRVLIVPNANPDGFARNTRGNANGVDINRNFPTRNWSNQVTDDKYTPGPSAGSEPETKTLIEIIETERPDVIVSIHQPLECINYDGPAVNMAEKLVEATGLPLMQDIGYSTPGSLGTYTGIERDIPTITVELPWKADTGNLKKKFIPALLMLIAYP